MSFRDDLRSALISIRQIPQDLGVRSVRVVLTIETWTAPINTAGATATRVEADMIPWPKVRKAGQDVALLYGAGPSDTVSGKPTANIYTVGPITPECTAGGYSVLDLLSNTTNTTARRVGYVWLAGDGIGSTATELVPHELVDVDSARPFSTRLIVRQTTINPQDARP